ncbi:MAG: DNA methyltransferase, partial [Polaromonas sp.]|nr:DNA methyltransferase [Polaromonas sp.]
FFYTAKASTSERDKGLEDLPALTPGEKTGREDDTAGISPYAGARADGGRNIHPTVKSISLMRWCVRLVSPPGSWDPDIGKRPVIVDMFAGSGSTLVAGLAEGVRVIGCEMQADYADIARRRCQHAYALPREEAGIERAEDAALPKGQSSLF